MYIPRNTINIKFYTDPFYAQCITLISLLWNLLLKLLFITDIIIKNESIVIEAQIDETDESYKFWMCI